ncbi:CoA-acylating methylmalonate-semialdehyde dehydrogenase [Capillimicrobium parvum]|uniref:methylmalonate-semialdehyde dehydrogenase (CoA acylating) n=1 Tax=Capillimicrobium parvum TaxID=2884022 RepID=A0A9E6XVN9_9ACTN|nr:CoA-acylating methylmalonate-semialdehyde dehydrogenase [Capillimicrobium parvum]UGS35315.1 Malonate-semialdehyde dehydrogenase [Capillimicrobium parvum]
MTADTVPRPTDTRMLANFVGGAWTPSAATDSLEDRDPATGELLARVPLSTAADVDGAVTAARAAAATWRATSPLQRARAVMALREVLNAHHDELAELVSRDMGKTLADAAAEVGRGIESCEAATAMPHLLKGENLEGVATGVDVEMIRQPVGVVAAITPFNFPAMIPLWFLPYAVAAGNAFVLKPSEQDPLPGERIVELAASVDAFPTGLINLVHGAHDAVNALLDHPGVDAVSFVGSARTARYVAERAIASGKRVQALGGAKNSMVVMPDADPELMAGGVMGSAFGAAGQRCLAGSIAVLVGTRAEQDAARDRIVEAAARLRTGPGLDPDTDVCPVVDPAAHARLVADIEQAAADGATVVLDGRGDPGPGGCLLGPTILDDVPAGHRAIEEELFGPVLTLVRAADLDEAIDLVNAGRYGNASVIFTESGGAARAYRYGVQAGMVGVNVGVAAPVAWFPFSGWKDSIDGDLHANGRDAVEFYTRKKVVTTRWAA